MEDLKKKIVNLVNEYPNADDVAIADQIMQLIVSYTATEMLQKFKWLNHFDDSELREIITSELKALKDKAPTYDVEEFPDEEERL